MTFLKRLKISLGKDFLGKVVSITVPIIIYNIETKKIVVNTLMFFGKRISTYSFFLLMVQKPCVVSFESERF